MRVIKVEKFKNYSSKEVRNLPEKVQSFKFMDDENGGWYFHFNRMKDGIVIYFGDDRVDSSEPIFKINHKFKTRNEAIFYINYLIRVIDG